MLESVTLSAKRVSDGESSYKVYARWGFADVKESIYGSSEIF